MLRHIIEIVDSKGNIVFKIPPNTLLEKIIDQWSLIIGYYRSFHPFVIGDENNPDMKYYREVTKQDLESPMFMKLLIESYKNNCGIYVIGHIESGLISIDRYPLWSDDYVNDNNVGMMPINIYNGMFRIAKTCYEIKCVKINNNLFYPYEKKIPLMILLSYTF